MAKHAPSSNKISKSFVKKISRYPTEIFSASIWVQQITIFLKNICHFYQYMVTHCHAGFTKRIVQLISRYCMEAQTKRRKRGQTIRETCSLLNSSFKKLVTPLSTLSTKSSNKISKKSGKPVN